MRMRLLVAAGITAVITLLGLGLGPVVHAEPAAQPGACGFALDAAIMTAQDSCADLEVGQACYAFPEVEADLHDEAGPFDAPGDVVALEDIETLTLSPYDPASGIWGMVYMRLPAEDGDGDFFTILYGDVTVSFDEDLALSLETGPGEDDCDFPTTGMLVSAEPEEGLSVTINGDTLDIFGEVLLTTDEDGELVGSPLDLEADVAVADEDAPVTVGEEPVEVPAELTDALTGSGGSPVTEEEVFTSTSDGLIIPRAGTWELVWFSIAPLEACDGVLGTDGRRALQEPRTAEFDFSDGIDLQIFTEQIGGGPLDGVIFENPETNVYTATDNNFSPPIRVRLVVVSETEIAWSLIMEQVTCLSQTINWWEWRGE